MKFASTKKIPSTTTAAREFQSLMITAFQNFNLYLISLLSKGKMSFTKLIKEELLLKQLEDWIIFGLTPSLCSTNQVSDFKCTNRLITQLYAFHKWLRLSV